MNFEEKIAYEIGVRIAQREYMEKQSMQAVLKGAKYLFGKGNVYDYGKVMQTGRKGVGGLKYLAGFGKGEGTYGALNRTIGSGVGFGLMGAASAEGGLENKLMGFGGGFLGGLAFSGAMPVVGKLGKGLNRSFASTSKNFSKATRDQAKLIDQQMKSVRQMEKQVSKQKGFFGKNPVNDKLNARLEKTRKELADNKDMYKQFLKDEGIGMPTRLMGSLSRNYGAAVGMAGGMGAGIMASGAIEGNTTSRQRPMLPMQNNVFNPVGSFT